MVKRRKNHAPVFVLLVALVLTSAVTGCRSSSASSGESEADGLPAEEAAVTLSVRPAEIRSFGNSVTALGRFDALPEKLAILSPAIEGKVTKLLAKPGDDLASGQPVVQLD